MLTGYEVLYMKNDKTDFDVILYFMTWGFLLGFALGSIFMYMVFILKGVI